MSESDTFQNRPEKEIFLAALEKQSAEERAAFLDGACGANAALRARVEALLANHFAQDPFMQEPAAAERLTIRVTSVEEVAGKMIGRYKLLQLIGEGGCGMVYMAEQEEPVRRRVALKVIKLGMDTKQVIARFEAERQALAMMDHPNIAKVLDASATETGRPYFVMELVKGIPITRYCDEHSLSTASRLDLFVKICQAIQHAHQKGIIHRDIKPSNILVADHDGVPVPKIIDFGIAKATNDQQLTDKTLFTALEQFIGTPAYMSPEQANLSGLDIDTRTDIYSLGVMLYELLTGKTPFEASRLHKAGLDEVRRIIREEEPVRPSTRLHTLAAAEQTTVAKQRQADPPKLSRLITGDLDWIVMKCLEKDRARRYETANGLAVDIQRHLNNEPVLARPPSSAYRFQKMVRRNKMAFTAVAVVVAALILGLGVSTWMFAQERKARQRAVAAEREQNRLRLDAEKARADEAAQRVKVQEKSAQLAETLSKVEQQKINEVITKEGDGKGLSYLARALRQNPENYRAAYRLLSLLSCQNVARLISEKKYESDVRDTCYSGLGPLVLTRTGGKDVWLWDYRREQPLAGPLSHTVAISEATFTPSGRKFLVTLADGTIEVWSTANTLAPLGRIVPRHSGVLMSFSPDESKLVTDAQGDSGDYRTRVFQVWDLNTGQPLTQPAQYEGSNFGVSAGFTQNGRFLIQEFIGAQRIRSILDIVAGKIGPKQTLSNVIYDSGSDDDTILTGFVGSYQGIISIGSGNTINDPMSLLATRQVLLPLAGVTERNRSGFEQVLFSASEKNFSPDKRELLAVSTDRTVTLWDIGPHAIIPSRLTLPPGNASLSSDMEFSGDGRKLLTLHFGVAEVWDAATGRLMAGPLSETGTVLRARISPDGQRVAVGQTNGWLRLWDTASGQALTAPFRDSPTAGSTLEKAGLGRLSFSPDGSRLAAGWSNGVAQVWDADRGKLLCNIAAHHGPVYLIVFSPDGKWLATAGGDRTVRLWDAATGAAKNKPMQHHGEITCCQFSRDGKTLATGSLDKSARLWDLQNEQATPTALPHDEPVRGIFFQADGSLVTVAHNQYSQDTARVWDARSGALIQIIKLEQQNLQYKTIPMPQDGRFLPMICFDGTLRLWDPTTDTSVGEPIHLATIPNVYGGDAAAVSADGHSLALQNGNEVQIWDLPRVQGPVPEWLPRLAEALATTRISDQGLTERVAPGEFLSLRQKILATGADDAYLQWARWFLADRGEQTTSPLSNVRLEDHIKACIEANTPLSLTEALGLDPGNVKALSAYLKTTTKELLRVGDSPQVYGLGEEQLKQMRQGNARQAQAMADRVLEVTPDSAVAWHAKAVALYRLDQSEEALAALAKADPAQVGPDYWEAKALMEESLGKNEDAYESLSKAIETSKTLSALAASASYLRRSQFLRSQNRLAEAGADLCLAKGIPLRDAATKPNLIDLSLAYTSPLTNIPELFAGSEVFNDLPAGVHTLGGTEWDIRGLLYASAAARGRAFMPGNRPTPSTIPVGLRCGKLHFLQSAAVAQRFASGQVVEKFTLHYADQQTREIPVRLGDDLCDWFYYDNQPLAKEAPTVWVGLSERARSIQSFTRLFKMSWTNPLPDVEIQSMNVSYEANLSVIPILVAVTADPASASNEPPRQPDPARQSLETLDQAMARHPEYWPLARAKANILARQNRGEEALSLLSELLAKPDTSGAVSGFWLLATTKASLLEDLKRTNDAISFLSQAMADAEVKGKLNGAQNGSADGMVDLANTCRDLGLSRQACVALQKRCDSDPKDTILSLQLGAWQVWFGQDADYEATRVRLVQQAQDTDVASTAERAAKVCCLRPSTNATLLAKALGLAQRAVELGSTDSLNPWYQLTLGLAEYRNGHYANAERALKNAEQAAGASEDVVGTALLVHTMSLCRQSRLPEAQKLFQQAEAHMPPLPKDQRGLMSDGNLASHDVMIWWLSYKEAKALLNEPSQER